MSAHTVSACLIVCDEAASIETALASVAFCDEVIVVDSGSTDGTQALARAGGATVVEHPWPGFGAQRNVAIDHARGDWILELDADETISPALAAEIARFLHTPGARDRVDILALPMRHRFLGRELGPAMHYPNYRARMFRRGSYRHDEGRTVHEGIKPRDTALALQGEMTHELASTWREALGDTWRYARFEATQFHPRLTPASVMTGMVVRPPSKAAYRLVVDGAWRDGWRGAVKVGLEAGSDALVWARVLARGAGGDDNGHFGERMPGKGALRLVAVATDATGLARCDAWLREALAAGAGSDSELLTAAGDPAGAVPYTVRSLEAGGPLALARALSGTHQVRHVDAILLGDRGARRAHRLLARRVRGRTAPLEPSEAPWRAVTRLTAELRG